MPGMKPPNDGDSGGGTALFTSESQVHAGGVLVFEVKVSAEGAENMDGALEIKLEVKDVAQMRMLII